MKKELFQHNECEYEIRIASNGMKTFIRVFKDGKPANGYEYSVELPIIYDMQKKLGIDPVEDLVNNAKSDVIEGRWEQYIKALESHNANENK